MGNAQHTQQDNYFELFNLKAQFTLDMRALDRAYRAVQAQVHPDRFAAMGEAQKRIATQWAARINEAYGALKDPLKRAVHLLRLRGFEMPQEDNAAMEPAFLMQQLEWRERIEEAVASKDSAALSTLLHTLRVEADARFAALAQALDACPKQETDQAAALAVQQLRFIERVICAAQAQLEKLEGM